MSEAQDPFAPWLEGMLAVARHYRLEASAENARVLAGWEGGPGRQNAPALGEESLARLAGHLGLEMRASAFSADLLDPWRLPLLAEFASGRDGRGSQIGVLEKTDGETVTVRFSGDQGLTRDLPASKLAGAVRRVLILRPRGSVRDIRVDDYIRPCPQGWFRQIIFRDWAGYLDVIVASLVANLLALAGILFSIQVYDRVVPAQSLPTLYVLFGGVLLAIVFEFIMRLVRARITDIVGKRADLRLSDLVYGHALRLRSDSRPKSSGTFMAQLRELDSLREIITSTSLGAMVDLPFVLLFFFILWLIGGALVLIPLAALPLLVIPGLLAQRPLARLSQEGMRESALRNAMLVEAVQAGEDIKLLRAEPRFQNQWNQAGSVAAEVGLRQRRITAWLTTLSQETQSLVFAVTLFIGAHLVIKGEISTGVLIGVSILGSRTIVPLAQWAGVFSRLQQARVAYRALDELMRRPADQAERMLHRPHLSGAYSLRNLRFFYEQEESQPSLPSLEIPSLDIAAGERVAVLGRMGSGKSTLLHLLAGLHRLDCENGGPSQGTVLLDGARLEQIDPADLRRDLGYLSQTAHLFHGSLRENLTMGRPLATDQEMFEALRLAGALPLVQAEGQGLDYLIREGGLGLSGGQRQALLLARTILLNPRILLLDEPTTALDDVSEAQVVRELAPWLAGRTLVVATHRPALLAWVDKILLLNQGRLVLAGPRDAVLAQLSGTGEKPQNI